MYGSDCSIIDVGGQDTKFIQAENGMVVDFLMNDKCSANKWFNMSLKNNYQMMWFLLGD